MSKTVRIIALVLVALMILSLIPTVAFGETSLEEAQRKLAEAQAEEQAALDAYNKASEEERTVRAAYYKAIEDADDARRAKDDANEALSEMETALELAKDDVKVKRAEYDEAVRTSAVDPPKDDPKVRTALSALNASKTERDKAEGERDKAKTAYDSALAAYNAAVGVEAEKETALESAVASKGTQAAAYLTAQSNTEEARKEVIRLSGGTTPTPLPTGHHLSHRARVAPTATDPGWKAHWVCTDEGCGRMFWDRDAAREITDYNEVIIPAGDIHDTDHLIFVGYEPATCTEAGHSAHYFCPICKLTFDKYLRPVNPYIKPTGHRWSHWSVVKRPTPTQPGLERCFCYNKNCGAEKYFTIYYNENPKTGDESNMALWISLAAVALLGTAGAVWYMKRKKEN